MTNRIAPKSKNNAMFPDYSYNETLETEHFTDTTHTAEFSSSGSSEEDFTESAFPCSYCKCKDYNSLARCRNCNKYFCNNKLGVKTSHIINHLISSQHHSISLHPESTIGETNLQCMFSDCAVENVFTLSLIAKDDDSHKFIIACKGHSNKPIDETNFGDLGNSGLEKLKESIPLTGNKQVYGLLLSQSTNEYIERNCVAVEDVQISVLEKRWMAGDEASIEELVASVTTFKPIKVKNKYLSPTHYRDVFSPLVELEREADRRSKSLLNRSNIRVGVKEFHRDIEFEFNLDTEEGGSGISLKSKIQIGDEIMINIASKNKDVEGESNSKNSNSNNSNSNSNKNKNGRNKNTYGDSIKCFITRVFERTKVNCRPYSKKVSIMNDGGRNLNKDVNGRYFTGNVKFVWIQASFDRMAEALYQFSHEENMSNTVIDTILGDIEDRDRKVKRNVTEADLSKIKTLGHLPELNVYQKEALFNVMRNKFSLVQGPPGTGKTTLSANIAYNFVLMSKAWTRVERKYQNVKEKVRKGKVLICAPSNCAVDHICEKLAGLPIKVVRIYARIKESNTLSPQMQKTTLHVKVAELVLAHMKRRLQDKKKKKGMEIVELVKDMYKETKYSNNRILEFSQKLRASQNPALKAILDKYERNTVKAADVICCTCVTAGRKQITKYKCEYVLIDESSQSTEPESLIPMVNGAKKVVMVGDHYQLGPVVIDKIATKAGFQQSLFERLTKLGMEPFVLRIQYRMHPEIIRYSNNAFYRGILENGVGKRDRTMGALKTFFPNVDMPVFFKTCFKAEEISANGTSYLNRTEAKLVLDMVNDLLNRGMKPESIGIITPYDGQRRLLTDMMETENILDRSETSKIEIDSVDAFQGREKDIIIISCVRSNPYKNIGFLADYRRLNVAITRAKYGNVVIGNPRLLVVNKLWDSFIGYFELNGLIVDEDGNKTDEKFSSIEKEEDIYKGVEEFVKVKKFNRKDSNKLEHYYSRGNEMDSETSGHGIDMQSEYSELAWSQESELESYENIQSTGWDEEESEDFD